MCLQVASVKLRSFLQVQAKRSEKLLAALAAGLWLVNLTWITASDEAGEWQNEEEHEL